MKLELRHHKKENILKNDLTNKASIYSIGISDFTGISRLHLQDLNEGAAAHTENRETIQLDLKTGEPYLSVMVACHLADFVLGGRLLHATCTSG